MTLDAPNTFLKTIFPKDEATEESDMMKLRGILVNVLLLEEIAPEACSKFVTYQNNK